jgi:hypothetical protein
MICYLQVPENLEPVTNFLRRSDDRAGACSLKYTISATRKKLCHLERSFRHLWGDVSRN